MTAIVALLLVAADPAPGTIELQILEASNTPGEAVSSSPAARDLASTMQLKNVRVVRKEERSVADGALDEGVPLPNGELVRVSVVRIDREKRDARLRVRVQGPKEKLETEYTVRWDGTVFVSAGAFGKGSLVVAISPHLR